jgi:hypothetical protein
MKLPVLLYRWVDQKDPNIKYQKLGYETKDEYGIDVDIVNYDIKANGKTITAEEYLSTSKGEGGNITGFLQFHPTRNSNEVNILDNTPSYISVPTSHSAFGINRNLFVFPPYGMSPKDQEALVYTAGSLYEKVKPCPTKIKVAKLGSLMETKTHYGNDSEWNFIPNYEFKVQGLLIRFGKYVQDKHNKNKYNFVENYSRIDWDGLQTYMNKQYGEFEKNGRVNISQVLDFDTCE